MPRKTKEQKEIENKKETKKVALKSTEKTPKTTSKSTSKKTTSTKAIVKKEAKEATKKSTTKSNKTAKKATATKKKAVSKTPAKKKEIEIVEYYDLPYRYNQTIVKVLAQTPSNIFIYWDISDNDIKNYKKQYGENFLEITKPVLIVHNDTLDYAFEVDINDFANSWYLKVSDSKCEYRVELGRRPIHYKEKFNTDYIYITQSNEIESPNDRVLIDNSHTVVTFRNTKTNKEYEKPISDLKIAKDIREIYNIYDLYKLIYNDENIDEIYDLSNPSSSNPSSGTFLSNLK